VATRKCALCGAAQNTLDMLKVGKDRLCIDRRACYGRKLECQDDNTNASLKQLEK
jgi:hypothetical protein